LLQKRKSSSSSITQSSGICTIDQMGKRLWLQYKGLIDTYGLETKIPRDSGLPQTDRQKKSYCDKSDEIVLLKCVTFCVHA
jgi:hypothetical protein